MQTGGIMALVEWARMKAQEVRALADKNAVVILPIAAIEQHGPHLPTMTDTRIGAEVARRAAEMAFDTRPTLVTPVVWSGLSEHHMAFGGTLTLSPATFRAVLSDVIDAIIRNGFRNILISNSHGGNIIPMQQILDELAPGCAATLVGTCYVTEVGDQYGEILEDQESIQHGCEGETSMMMVCEPDLVDTSDLAALNSKSDLAEFLGAGRASYRWRPLSHVTASGAIGCPGKSSADKGEQLLETGARALADLICDPKTWSPVDDLRQGSLAGVPFRNE